MKKKLIHFEYNHCAVQHQQSTKQTFHDLLLEIQHIRHIHYLTPTLLVLDLKVNFYRQESNL